MSSSSERSMDTHKRSSPQEQVSPDRPSQRSSLGTVTSPSGFSKRSHSFSDVGSTNYSLPDACVPMMQSLNAERTLRKASSSMPGRSSAQSTKQTKYDTVVPVGQKRWLVKLHREPGKDVANYGLCDTTFSPTLGELIGALEANPKQFPKKKGRLQDCRAAPLTFKGKSYRAVFTLSETARTVFILAIDAHDEAYGKSMRR
jgi:hypothetical protein